MRSVVDYCGLATPSKTIISMSQSGRKVSLERRVAHVAEAALSRQQYVRAIDVLCGMGLLLPTHVDSGRKGRVGYLERVIQGNLHKISSSMKYSGVGLGKKA